MEAAIQLFKSQNIEVLEQSTQEYDRAIATSNLVFRFAVPDFVVRPKTTAHVQAIVKGARSKKLKLVIKCNGHSYAGHSTASRGSVSLDLRDMKEVKLDMTSRTITFDAGCQWGRVYQTLINGEYDGFVVNGGRCPTVGVGGFLLGGGLGPFTRSFGMGSDTMMEATLVTATGDLVTVKESDNRGSKEGQLFWALCGAGNGSFGVVVQMKLRVQQLQSKKGEVVAGRYSWFPDKGFTDDVITAMNDFYTADWPNQMTIDSNWICDLQAKDDGCIRFTLTFDGSKAEYDSTINKYIKREDLKANFTRKVLAEQSTRYLYETLFSQWFEETARAFPENKGYELYSAYVFKNDDRTLISKVTALIGNLMSDFRKDFKGEAGLFSVTWIHSGGKATEKKPRDSAFPWREAVFHAYVTVLWKDKWMEKDMRRFLDKVEETLRPLSLNGGAAFVNFPNRDFPKDSYEKWYFGENLEELRRIKQIWDPDNFFDPPQGIRLPGAPEGPNNEPRGEDATDQLASEQWKDFKRSRWNYYMTTDVKKDLDRLASLGY